MRLCRWAWRAATSGHNDQLVAEALVLHGRSAPPSATPTHGFQQENPLAPDAAAQLAAEDESSCGAADSFGGVHVCWAGATAPTAAHMSQPLRPIGMAQPHVLQTAMDLYRTRRADPP